MGNMHLCICKEAVHMYVRAARRSPETRRPFECKGLRKAHDALSADRRYSGEPGGGNGFTILGGETSPRRCLPFRDTRIDLRACTHALRGISRRSVGRTFGQKLFLEQRWLNICPERFGASGMRPSKLARVIAQILSTRCISMDPVITKRRNRNWQKRLYTNSAFRNGNLR